MNTHKIKLFKTMKLLFIFLFANTFTFAQTVTIPDVIFKNYLVNNASINTNADTEIQVSEANSFTGIIDCFNLSISDMTGIESFINLTQLKFAYNQVTNIDLSFNIFNALMFGIFILIIDRLSFNNYNRQN